MERKIIASKGTDFDKVLQDFNAQLATASSEKFVPEAAHSVAAVGMDWAGMCEYTISVMVKRGK